MAKSTRKARCRHTAFGEAVLSFPFDAGLVEAIKDGIPYRYRTYDPASKEWTVEAKFADFAIELLLRHFPDAEVPAWWRSRGRAEQRREDAWRSGTDHFRVLHLRETAPVELIEGAYRILARINHPDAGGTTEAMQQLNGAYVVLKGRASA